MVELIDFCRDYCRTPEAFWLSDSDEGIATKKAANVYNSFDLRTMTMGKAVRALYQKKLYSFVKAGEEREDTYYFPDGACFTTEKKINGWMAAAVLQQNPNSQMGERAKEKAAVFLAGGGDAEMIAPL